MSQDWESRALEAERLLEEKETKTKALIEAVQRQKQDWEHRIQQAESETAKWKAVAKKAEEELQIKKDQLANVSYRLDSLVALNEKNQKVDHPDKVRIAELEARLAMTSEGTELQRNQLASQKSEAQELQRELQLKISLQDQQIVSLNDQLQHANDRAFEAEGRLGREQALSRDLSAQLQLLKYGPKSNTATATSTTVAASEPTILARTELDDLELPDLDISIPSATPVADSSTVTKATLAIAAAQKTVTKANTTKPSAPAKKNDWGDIDSMLDDIGGGKK